MSLHASDNAAADRTIGSFAWRKLRRRRTRTRTRKRFSLSWVLRRVHGYDYVYGYVNVYGYVKG